MAITYQQSSGTFTLETKSSMYQMKVDKQKVLLHTYYGKRILPEDLSYLIVYGDRGFSGNPYEVGTDKEYSLDVLPQEYSTYGTGDFRTSALKVRHSDGAAVLDLRYDSYVINKGKYEIPGLPALYDETGQHSHTLEIILKDKATEVYVHLYYGVMEEADIITRAACIENKGSSPIYLEKACSICLDYQYGSYDLITFYGKHAMEREFSRVPVHHGIQSIGSTRVASSHHYNPFMILCDRNTTEEFGECYGFSFLYSGDFIGEAEYDQMQQTRIIMGIHPENFTYQVAPGERFYTPEAAMAYSEEGLSKLSHIFHKAYRHHLCRGKYKTARRPILINNWEGTYFQFTGDKLIQMAEQAANLGVELFVMDDGWFGKREDDLSGLGDWYVNEQKLGCTLKELADKIIGMGMKFGIWFEPEAVSEDSDLYRKHPDWAFKVPGRTPMRARYQLVLDFSRKEVRDYICERISEVLESAPISYVKWDYNRNISDIYSSSLPAERQGEVAHRYVLGLYEVLEYLNQRFPDVMFEGCSGGGGRFDAGMLYYTPQIWCSDDTDAIERIKIQYGTSFGYPISAVGSHVSACPNHQTGRVTPFYTRAVTAMSGTFGYELDVNHMTEEEKEAVKQQIAAFCNYYFLIQDGRYYRLNSPYEEEAFTAWEFASEDGREALVNVVCTHVYANPAPGYVKVKGLSEDAKYRINGSEQIYGGGALMHCGFPLPHPKEEYEAFQFHLVQV